MDLKVKHEEYNALLKRKEVLAEVDHEEGGTPSRADLRKAVAAKYGAKPESVYIVDVRTGTGTQSASCEVQVYDDQTLALKTVPKHIQVRHLPAEERKRVKEEQAKKAEAKPKAEKPKPTPKTAEKPQEEKPKAETKPATPEAPKKEKEPQAK